MQVKALNRIKGVFGYKQVAMVHGLHQGALLQELIHPATTPAGDGGTEVWWWVWAAPKNKEQHFPSEMDMDVRKLTRENMAF